MCDNCSSHSHVKEEVISDENRKDIITAISEDLLTFSKTINGHPIATLKDQQKVNIDKIKENIKKLDDETLARLYNLTGWVESK